MERTSVLLRNKMIVLYMILAICFIFPQSAMANRIIRGTITHANGSAAAGLLVQAYDSDTGTNDDFMGSDTTDSSGYYSIAYADKHWDYAPPGFTTWRPDIYVKVKVATRDTWVLVKKSGTYDNWKLRDDLTVNFTVPDDVWTQKNTGFNPEIHGFPFANESSVVCIQPACTDEHWISPVLQSFPFFQWSLCGGMCLTALDRFERGVAVEGTVAEVKDELVRNQIETLFPTNWETFIEWQARPTEPHTFDIHTIGYVTKGEWGRVRGALDRGKPVILGLIREQSYDPSSASKNHQVIAIGYRVNDLKSEVEIYVYDPNYPKCTSILTMNTGLPESQLRAAQKVEQDGVCQYSEAPTLRGFFVVHESAVARKELPPADYADGDGILDQVDTLPLAYSSDFSDKMTGGMTSGTILERGGQYLTIADEPAPGGVRILTNIFGGTEEAVVTACENTQRYALGADAQVGVTCSGLAATAVAIKGIIRTTFSSGGQQASAQLREGNGITFDWSVAERVRITAQAANTESLLVVFDGKELFIAPGSTVIPADLLPDNEPPVAYAGPDQIVECKGATTSVMMNGASSMDPDDDPLSFLWTGSFGQASGEIAAVSLALGSHEITLTVDDSNGGAASDAVAVLVQDMIAPVVDAGQDAVVEATSTAGASYDVRPRVFDECSATSVVIKPEIEVYPMGTTLVTVTATDSSGNSASDEILVSVVDTTSPRMTVPPDMTIEATGSVTLVDPGSPTATDIFPVLITNDAPGGGFPLGSTVITWTATDANGNSTTGQQTITIVDTTPPDFKLSSVYDTLWPPDHRLVRVALVSSVHDAVDPSPRVVINVTSNEPEAAASAWRITKNDDLWEIWVRAERSGGEKGRLYIIDVEVSDAFNNSAHASHTVRVPHDQRKAK